jgi:hypothetical protein
VINTTLAAPAWKSYRVGTVVKLDDGRSFTIDSISIVHTDRGYNSRRFTLIGPGGKTVTKSSRGITLWVAGLENDRGEPTPAVKPVEKPPVSPVVSSLVAARAESIGYDVAGDYVDVGRFLSGEPECFGVRVCDESQAKPVIRINVNTAVSASVSASAIFGRGAAILAAIDVIEATGSRVEVWAVNGNVNNKGNHVHETYALIKSASQPLDIDRLAFAFCHQASHRRLAFSVFEHYGIRAGESCPHEVSITEGINTRPARRSQTFTRQELLEEIKWICDRAGVCISQEEIDALAAA